MQINFYQLLVQDMDSFLDKTAVVCESKTITYQTLIHYIDMIAGLLKEKHIQADDIVALYMGNTIEMVASVFAILKIGAVVLPIDEKIPFVRVEQILSIAEASCLICSESSIGTNYANKQVIHIDSVKLETMQTLTFSNTDITYNNAAYCIFTSGSTGVPKGVMLPCEGINNHMKAKRKLMEMTESDVVCLSFSISFVASIWQILLSLTHKMTLILYNAHKLTNMAAFFEYLKTYRASVISLTPTLFQTYMQSLKSGNHMMHFPDIRCIVLTGEKLEAKPVKDFYQIYQYTTLVNAYGQSECSDDTYHYVIPRNFAGDSVPIGKPIENIIVNILDDDMNPVDDNAVGQLYIGGICLSVGYINNVSLQNEMFINNSNARMFKTGDLVKRDTNGIYYYIGRCDNQIKLRGYRVEPEEIEAYINRYNTIRQSIVLCVTQTDTPYLACFYTSDTEIDDQLLIKHLKEKLPEYMLPAQFIRVFNFPLSSNGKTDRRALYQSWISEDSVQKLPTPSDQESQFEEPLIKIVKKVLNRRHSRNIKLNTHLQDLQIDSISFMKIIIEVEEYFKIEFDYEMMDTNKFEKLDELADYIKDRISQQ